MGMRHDVALPTCHGLASVRDVETIAMAVGE